MNKDSKYKTVWHQPENNPTLGTVNDVLKCLKRKKIKYALGESWMKDHVAISVPHSDEEEAIEILLMNFGRR